MLGWGIFVRKVVLDSTLEDSDELEDFSEKLSLASWSAGIGGIRWLEELVSDGKVTRSGDGYPVRYRSTAGVILPLIAAGIPFGKSPQVIGDDYFLPRNWGGDVVIHTDNVKDCKPTDILLIDAWYQS